MFFNIILIISVQRAFSDRIYTKNAIMRLQYDESYKSVISDRRKSRNVDEHIDNLIAEIIHKEEININNHVNPYYYYYKQYVEEMPYLHQILRDKEKNIIENPDAEEKLEIEEIKMKIKNNTDKATLKYIKLKEFANILATEENNFTKNNYGYEKPIANLSRLLNIEINNQLISLDLSENQIYFLKKYENDFYEWIIKCLYDYYYFQRKPASTSEILYWIRFYVPHFNTMIISLRDYKINKDKANIQDENLKYLITLIYEFINSESFINKHLKLYDILMFNCNIIIFLGDHVKCLAYQKLIQAIESKDIKYINDGKYQ